MQNIKTGTYSKFSGAEVKDNSSLVSVMSSTIPKDAGRYTIHSFTQFKK